MAKTVIKFKFLKPGALPLSRYSNDREGKEIYNYGIFEPETIRVEAHDYYEKHPEELGNQQLPPRTAGNAWVMGLNYDKIHAVTLLDEEAGELPRHLASLAHEDDRRAYRNETLKRAAHNHSINNMVREDLQEAVDRGLIEVLSDSFFAKQEVEKPQSEIPEATPRQNPQIEGTAPSVPPKKSK